MSNSTPARRIPNLESNSNPDIMALSTIVKSPSRSMRNKNVNMGMSGRLLDDAPAAWSRTRVASMRMNAGMAEDGASSSPPSSVTGAKNANANAIPVSSANTSSREKILHDYFGDEDPLELDFSENKVKARMGNSNNNNIPRQPKAKVKIDRFGFFVDKEQTNSSTIDDQGLVVSSDEITPHTSNTRKHKFHLSRSKRRSKKQEKEEIQDRISGLRSQRVASSQYKRNVTQDKDRIRKWKKMLRNWKFAAKDKNKKTQRRLRKGVPHELRGQVWSTMGKMMLSSDFNSNCEETSYDSILEKAAQVGGQDKDLDRNYKQNMPLMAKVEIERDIGRTFPRHHLFFTPLKEENDLHRPTTKIAPITNTTTDTNTTFSDLTVTNIIQKLSCNKTTPESESLIANTLEKDTTTQDQLQRDLLLTDSGGQACLRRVLRAYAIYDPETGYCQGMNFIAAMFITFTTEEQAFWLLVAVMNRPPCHMRDLYGMGMAKAQQCLFVAEHLIGQFLPKLSSHFQEENIHITMFATQWLLTLYTSNFPFDLVTRVWDCFLFDGWKIVYRVMLSMLTSVEGDLLKLKFEEILGFIRELPNKVNGEKVMEEAFKIPLKRKHIIKYKNEWTAANDSSLTD